MSKSNSAASNRACDRCRRRKAKCDFADSTCSRCHIAGLQCTFDLPIRRRGPKTRYPPAIALRTLRQAVSPSSPVSHRYDSIGTAGISPSDTTWDIRTRNIDVAPSPLQQKIARSPISDRASSWLASCLQRWNDLSAAVTSKLPTFTLERIIERCFNLYFEYLFPLIPLVHEPSLREGLAFFLTGNLSSIRHGGQFRRPTIASTASVTSDSVDSATLLENPDVWPESTFTLITALCAEAAFLLPLEIFPEGDLIADTFLKASRNCLESYLEADLEQPNANSITIRYFHSNCLHAAGKPKYSWHIFGEATRLAQVMQLNDQAAYETSYPVEAELRRRAFWIVYTGDKSAAILNNRPITIHKFSFESGITASYPSGSIVTDPPTSPVTVDNAPRQRNFVTGFNANIRLWQTASDLLLEIRMLQERGRIAQAMQPQHPLLSNDDINSIDALYVRFITCLDDLPYYLQMDNFGEVDGDDYHSKRSATIQRVNLQVSFHCLRMVVLQKLSALEIATQAQANSHMLNLRKTEVARDMLRVIREAPFWALQMNGEPCVEKIRLIGASLLAILHEDGAGVTSASPLSTRARSDFTVLLDILTRLDSKASDTLRNSSL